MTIIKKTLAEIESKPLVKERLTELQVLSEGNIDTSDIPELGDDLWKCAKVRFPADSEETS